MSDSLFKCVMALIPVIGAVITGYLIPYIKTKLSSAQLDEISKWVSKAVQTAEVLYDLPESGEEKREYVINFIDQMFNSKKETITQDQIRILLESSWNQLTKT